MLAETVPGRLLVRTLFALMDGTPLPVGAPPEVCGLLSILEARERDECRGDGVQLAQERSARDPSEVGSGWLRSDARPHANSFAAAAAAAFACRSKHVWRTRARL